MNVLAPPKARLSFEVVYDLICPWCYLGVRRLLRTFRRRPDLLFELSWRPFLLNPDMPRTGMARPDYVIRKFGGEERAKRLLRLDHRSGPPRRHRFRLRAHPPHAILGRRPPPGALCRPLRPRRPGGGIAVLGAFLRGLRHRRSCRAGRDRRLPARLDAAEDQSLPGVWTRRPMPCTPTNLRAHRLGINGVPCFVIGGRHAIAGAQEPRGDRTAAGCRRRGCGGDVIRSAGPHLLGTSRPDAAPAPGRSAGLRGIWPPRQPECTPRPGGRQRPCDQRGPLGHPRRHGEFRQQRDAQSVGDHLHQRVQAGGRETVLRITLVPRQQPAHRQRLFTEAMPLLEQQQPFGRQRRDRDRRPALARRWSGGSATTNSSRATGVESAPPQSHGSASSKTSSRLLFSRSTRCAVVSSRRNSRRLGNAERNTGISFGNRNGPIVGMMPSRNGPLNGARAVLAASATASSAAASAACARSTRSRPSGVKTTCLPAARSRICASSWRSSARMPADSVDWVTAQVSAARPKCRDSARVTR